VGINKKRAPLVIIACLFILILFQLISVASEIYVPDDYSTIQAAIDAASSGDTIIVGDGIYNEKNIVVNKPLSIHSENGPDLTTIQEKWDSSNLVWAFEIKAEQVSIEGFKILNIGIYIDNVDNCHIQNNKFAGSHSGVVLDHANHCNIIDNFFESCGGIHFGHHTDHNTVENNILENCEGIVLTISSNNFLNSNTITDGVYGLALMGGVIADNILSDNLMSNNKYNFALQEKSKNQIDTSNKINGKPIYYITDKENLVIDPSWGDIGYLGIVNCSNILIKDILLTENYEGLAIYNSTNIEIKNVSLTNNRYGIYSTFSDNCIFSQNTLSNNYYGLSLRYCVDNILFMNNFLNNTYSTYYNVSIHNYNNWYSQEEITYTYNNATYTNYLGNYWDDYSGIDTNNDGIGDAPHDIDTEQDNYPLMQPFENYTSSTGNQPPTIEIIAPSDGETVTEPVSISLNATDDYGLEKIEYYLDGELFDGDDPFGSGTVIQCSCSMEIHGISNGNHTFKAKAYDTAGQTSVDTVSFIVEDITENQPPTVEITDGPTGTIDYNDVTFTWSGNDPDGEVEGYYYGLDNASPDTWTTETTHTFNDVSEGDHTFYVQAIDNQGATSSVASRSFNYTPSAGTADIFLRDVEFFTLQGSDPNNISVEMDLKNNGEVAINSFNVELYANEVVKDNKKYTNGLEPGENTTKYIFVPLSEDMCGDNMNIEVKITEVEPVESIANRDNNSKNKKFSIHYVPFNINQDAYSFSNNDFCDSLSTGTVEFDIKGTAENLKDLGPFFSKRGIILYDLAKLNTKIGACLGMSSTVVAYKEGELPIPNDNVFDLEPSQTDVKDNIIKYQNNVSHSGINARRMYDKKMSNFPNISDEYQKIIDSLKEGKLIMLSLGESGTLISDGGHQLVAFRCIVDISSAYKRTYVYAYDSNQPGTEVILEGDYLNASVPISLSWSASDPSYENYDMLWAEELTQLASSNLKEYFNNLADSTLDKLKSTKQSLINVYSSSKDLFKNRASFEESTADILITDEFGRKTGYINGKRVNEIPDALIEIFGNLQSYHIPSSLHYNIQINGNGEGLSNLFLNKTNPDDTMLGVVYEDLPTEDNSVASFSVGPSSADYDIQLDHNGDGVIDETKEPDYIEGVPTTPSPSPSPPTESILGDFGSANGGPPDCKVDSEDLAIFNKAYVSTPSDDNWNPICDIASEDGVLEPDGVIDFEDLMVFSMQYGKTCSDE
jgi:parallel beta-helix repeat protein